MVLTRPASVRKKAIKEDIETPEHPLQVTWNVPNGPAVTRAYASARQLADEEARSRIWGGIHFEFESLASRGACSALADYVADNMLRPW